MTVKSGLPPAVVAGLRGLVEAMILAAVGWLTVEVSAVDVGQLAPFAPVALLALRQLEGLIDQRIDPTRQRVCGGTPVSPPPSDPAIGFSRSPLTR